MSAILREIRRNFNLDNIVTTLTAGTTGFLVNNIIESNNKSTAETGVYVIGGEIPSYQDYSDPKSKRSHVPNNSLSMRILVSICCALVPYFLINKDYLFQEKDSGLIGNGYKNIVPVVTDSAVIGLISAIVFNKVMLNNKKPLRDLGWNGSSLAWDGSVMYMFDGLKKLNKKILKK